MGQFRCTKCRNLQFKHRIRGNKVEIEVKCYACNTYSYFTIWLNKLPGLNKNKNEKNNK